MQIEAQQHGFHTYSFCILELLWIGSLGDWHHIHHNLGCSILVHPTGHLLLLCSMRSLGILRSLEHLGGRCKVGIQQRLLRSLRRFRM